MFNSKRETSTVPALLAAQEQTAALIRRHSLWVATIQYWVTDPGVGRSLPCVNVSVEPRPQEFRRWLEVFPFDTVQVTVQETFVGLYAHGEFDGIHWGIAGAIQGRALLDAMQVSWGAKTKTGKRRGTVPVGTFVAVTASDTRVHR
jgi:hypothetical protein